MRKVVITLLIAVFAAGILLAAQEKPAGEKKEARWSGTVVRSDKEGKTLTVRRRGQTMEKIIHFTDETKWTKGKETIDSSQVKDGDRVICLGESNEKKEFVATRIDLRTP
jgi:Ni/Co efflux regulator RcnB